MNLLNKQVRHDSFGKGNVVEFTDTIIKVRFPSGDRRFVFPDGFGTHLKLIDQETANLVGRLKQKIEKERRERESELEKMQAIEYEKRQRLLEWESLMNNHKPSPASQAAFWCDEQEQDKVFTEWRVFTGVKKSGPNKGEPNRLVRLHQNSACLITARDPGMPEKDRSILGVFMVNETFIGKLCEDGYIPAHSKYRLRLSEEESKQMLFWNYYLNERYPHNTTWNSGKHRYFDNVWMAQILQAIISLKEKSEELELAQNFFKHFCQMNRISERDLPKPNGALARIEAAMVK